jgi:hypothetical protein
MQRFSAVQGRSFPADVPIEKRAHSGCSQVGVSEGYISMIERGGHEVFPLLWAMNAVQVISNLISGQGVYRGCQRRPFVRRIGCARRFRFT